MFLLDLAQPRTEHLTDAAVLFGATDDTVFVRDDGAFAVDVATGARSSRDIPNDALPDRDAMWFVDGRQVKHRSLRSGVTRVVVSDRREWSLLYQYTSTIARSYDGQTAHAFLLANGKVTRLPQIEGGASIVGVANAGNELWSLIGHNTSNFDGDLWTTAHEADVCRLDPKAASMRFDSRSLPARYANDDVIADARSRYPSATWQVLEYANAPATLYVHFANEDGGDDLDALRARVREMHETVTSRFGDRELRTQLHFRDGRSAIYRWRRDRLRGRALAGIGDVMLYDAADFDAALAEHVNQREGDRITCRGKLTNVGTEALDDVEARCIAGDRDRTIQIAKIAPKETVEFSQTFEASENDYLELELFRGRAPLVVYDRDREVKDLALRAFFIELHKDTKLALREHRAGHELYILFDAPVAMTDVDSVVRAAAQRIEAARSLFAIEGKPELDLEVYVDKKYYRWDGASLVLQ